MRFGFAEFARRHGDYAMAGLAASAHADRGALRDVRLAYFGVGATPVRARNAETALAAGDLDAAVRALDRDLDPPGDVQASGAVKKHLAGVLLRRVARQLKEPPQ
jgi:carbon-monoxide dehydrogenase medium subunit